jgi:protein-tyrosine phosphatase
MHKTHSKIFFLIFLLAASIPHLSCRSEQALKTGKETDEQKRHIKLDGQPNFRDLGGYITQDGRQVKWGMVFRSGQLNNLTDADLAVLDKLNIRTVVDLRGTSEVETRGKDRLPDGVRGVSLPIDINSLPKEEAGASADASSAEPADFMLQATRSIMINKTDIYSALIRELAEPENRPLVFHCTAGKDRAGIGAAIVLTLLGVPWETVRNDYLLSNVYRKEENERELKNMRDNIAKQKGISPEQVDMTTYEAMFLVKPEYLQAAHDEAVRRYGSMDAYLRKGLGISDGMIDRLRSDLLE